MWARHALLLAAGILAAGAAVAETDFAAGRISRLDCQRLVRHLTRPDVAYRPGVGVRGEPVVPADVAPRLRPRLPDSIVIDITVDVCQRVDPVTGRKLCRSVVPSVNGPVEKQRYEAEVAIGTVTVAGDGRRVYLNGVPLTDERAALVYAACRRRMDRYRRPAED